MRKSLISVLVVTLFATDCSAAPAPPPLPDHRVRECLTRLPDVRRTAVCIVMRLGAKAAIEFGKAIGIEEVIRWAIEELKRQGVLVDETSKINNLVFGSNRVPLDPATNPCFTFGEPRGRRGLVCVGRRGARSSPGS